MHYLDTLKPIDGINRDDLYSAPNWIEAPLCQGRLSVRRTVTRFPMEDVVMVRWAVVATLPSNVDVVFYSGRDAQKATEVYEKCKRIKADLVGARKKKEARQRESDARKADVSAHLASLTSEQRAQWYAEMRQDHEKLRKELLKDCGHDIGEYVQWP